MLARPTGLCCYDTNACNPSHNQMSVRDTTARLAMPGNPAFNPSDFGQLACLGSIEDGDVVIQDKLVLRSGLADAAPLSFSLFDDYDIADKLSA